jgi:hypothetical protein
MSLSSRKGGPLPSLCDTEDIPMRQCNGAVQWGSVKGVWMTSVPTTSSERWFFRSKENAKTGQLTCWLDCLVTRPLGETLSRTRFLRRGLEHNARHLYGTRNFLGALHRNLVATFRIKTNPPSYDDDNELNFHRIILLTIWAQLQMATERPHLVLKIIFYC